jgi:hypothetical protein
MTPPGVTSIRDDLAHVPSIPRATERVDEREVSGIGLGSQNHENNASGRAGIIFLRVAGAQKPVRVMLVELAELE